MKKQNTVLGKAIKAAQKENNKQALLILKQTLKDLRNPFKKQRGLCISFLSHKLLNNFKEGYSNESTIPELMQFAPNPGKIGYWWSMTPFGRIKRIWVTKKLIKIYEEKLK